MFCDPWAAELLSLDLNLKLLTLERHQRLVALARRALHLGYGHSRERRGLIGLGKKLKKLQHVRASPEVSFLLASSRVLRVQPAC